MDIINGYELTGELKSDNSGYAKWGFARKNKTEYFIKEFLTPIYPVDDTVLSKKQILRKREICDKFEREKRSFYEILNKCSTGNIVTIADFFRYENKYYIVTEKIAAAPIEPIDVSAMNYEQKLLIIKIILYCVNSLHKHNIVHGDIKPDNILFKKTNGGMYTAKLIDFDSSFFSSEQPEDEEMQGDMVYLAPEAFLRMAQGEMILTTKIDVFALGVLFHQYFSGELPEFDKAKYDYVFEAVLDDCELKINEHIPEFIGNIIKKMLEKQPERRPAVDEIFNALVLAENARKKNNTAEISEENASIKSTAPVSRLKSTMRVRAEEKTTEHSANVFFKKPDDL